jgi:hypothetical protein
MLCGGSGSDDLTPRAPLHSKWKGGGRAITKSPLRAWRGDLGLIREPYSLPVVGGGVTALPDASISDCRSNRNGLLDGSKISCTLSLRFSI